MHKVDYINRLKALVTDREVNRIINVHNIAFIFYQSEIPYELAMEYIQTLAKNTKLTVT